jgi:hypothetical protein
MTDRFQSCGKEILRDGKHFADCLTPDDAETLSVVCNVADRVVSQTAGPAIVVDRLHWAGIRL